MNEQQLEQGKAAVPAADRGIAMFKEHIAVMKSGSWRLGGDRDSGDAVQEKAQQMEN